MRIFRPHQIHGILHQKNKSTRTYSKVLGIETSCDDTGCAIVDSDRNVLGDFLQSQQKIHLE